jgi:hypothetical protein
MYVYCSYLVAISAEYACLANKATQARMSPLRVPTSKMVFRRAYFIRWSATRSGLRTGDLSSGRKPGWLRQTDCGIDASLAGPILCTIITYGRTAQTTAQPSTRKKSAYCEPRDTTCARQLVRFLQTASGAIDDFPFPIAG